MPKNVILNRLFCRYQSLGESLQSGKRNIANSMHALIQHILDVSHRIAHIQSRSQQANHIVFGQARLLRCLLQSLYCNEDGYSVFTFHDFSPPFAGSHESGSYEFRKGQYRKHWVLPRRPSQPPNCPFLALKSRASLNAVHGGTSSSGASDGGVVRNWIPHEQTPESAHGGVMRSEQEN